MAYERAFIAVQTAIAGQPLQDVVSALADSFAICVGYSTTDAEHADRLLEALLPDLKAAVRRYAPEISENRARMLLRKLNS